MKRSVLLILLSLLVGLSFAQSDWGVAMEPTEPLAGSLDNYFFLSMNEGWLVGSPTSSDPTVIMHTTDGGATWTIQNSTPPGSDTAWQAVAFIDPMVGFVVGDDGIIWKSTDGGVNWVDVSPGFTTNRLRALSMVDANTVFVSGDDGLVLKTTDQGANWTDQTIAGASSSDLYDIYAWDANRAFLISGSNDGIVCWTADGGTTWNIGSLPYPPSGISARTYACNGIAGGIGYAAGYHGVEFKSTDYGQTWNEVASIFGPLFKIFWSTAAFNNTVWAGGSDGRLYRSSDAGATWDTLTYPTVNDVEKIFAFSENNVIFCSSYNIVYQSTDGGDSFTPMTTWPNLSWYALFSPSANKVIAASITGGEVSISNDAGANWSFPVRPSVNSWGDLLDIYFLDDNLGFVAGRDAQIAKTTDGGATWDLKPNSQYFWGGNKAYYFIHFTDAMNGFAGGSSGIVQVSTDGGETWTENSVGTTATLYDCDFFDANTGIISGSSGRIYQTVDAGANWTEVVDFGTMTMKDIAILNSTTAIICSYSGFVFKTTDAGANWTQVVELANINSPGDAPDLYSVDFVNATTGYICGEDAAIYKSIDAGDNWTQQTAPIGYENLTYEGMAWITEQVGFIGAQNGYIFTNSATGISNPSTVAKGYQLDQNFPNPFNPETTIGFNLEKSESVNLVIYNSLGQIVRNLELGQVSAGYHKVKWNGTNMFGLHSPSGIYFYKLEAGDFTQVNKMILMR